MDAFQNVVAAMFASALVCGAVSAQSDFDRLPLVPAGASLAVPVRITYTTQYVPSDSPVGAKLKDGRLNVAQVPKTDWDQFRPFAQSISLHNDSLRRTQELTSGGYIDFAISGPVAWALTTTTLNIADRDHPPAEGGRQYWTMAPEHAQEFEMFFSGCLANFIPADRSGGTLEMDDREWRWEAPFAPQPGVILHARGAFTPHGATVVATEVREAGVLYGGRSYYPRDWRWVESVGRNVAHEVLMQDPNGGDFRRYIVTLVEPISMEEFTSITSPPSPRGTDPIRGKLTLNGFEDFRPASRAAGRRTEEEFIMSAVVDAPKAGMMSFRTVGWLIAAGLTALAIGFRIRARSKSVSRT